MLLYHTVMERGYLVRYITKKIIKYRRKNLFEIFKKKRHNLFSKQSASHDCLQP